MDNLSLRAWDEQNRIMHRNFHYIDSGVQGNDWIVFVSDKQPLQHDERTEHPLGNPYCRQQLKVMLGSRVNDVNNIEFFEEDTVDNGEARGTVKFEDGCFFVDFGTVRTKLSSSYEIVGNTFEKGDKQ
jgi:hypothetical protein